MDQTLRDSYHDDERCNRSRPRQNAGNPVDLANSDDYDLGLDSGFTDVTVVAEMLKPYDARLMRCFPVSTRINNAANADPKCRNAVHMLPRNLFAAPMVLTGAR